MNINDKLINNISMNNSNNNNVDTTAVVNNELKCKLNSEHKLMNTTLSSTRKPINNIMSISDDFGHDLMKYNSNNGSLRRG